MNASTSAHQAQRDDGRRSRFAFDHHSALNGWRESSLPARATSQPPQNAFSAQRRFESPFGAPGTPPPPSSASIATGSTPWSPSRHASFNMNKPASPSGIPTRISPVRSLSFSTSSDLPSRFHPFMGESFPSTFEDDEDEYDELNDMNGLAGQDPSRFSTAGMIAGHNHAASMSGYDYPHPLRGTRAAALASADNSSRSRSQSLATTTRRQMPLGGGGSTAPHLMHTHSASGVMQAGWNDNVGGMIGSGSGAGYMGSSRNDGRNGIDLSNVSPFVRDLGQLHDEMVMRDLWSGMSYGGRDDGGASGTTSRRHSVSVVQPRTRRSSTIANFSSGGLTLGTAPGDDDTSPQMRSADPRMGPGGGAWDSGRMGGGLGSAGFALNRFNGGGRSMISDDDLASTLGSLALSPEAPQRSARGQIPHPSSLPAYAMAQSALQNQLSKSPGADQGLNGTQATSPSFRSPLSPHREPIGSQRGTSVSPARFNGRAVSRERDVGLLPTPENDLAPLRLAGSDSPGSQYRATMGNQQQWDGGNDMAGRVAQAMSSNTAFGAGAPPGIGRLPSPVSQRSPSSGVIQARGAQGFPPVTSPLAPSVSSSYNMSRMGSAGSSNAGHGLAQIRTNVGVTPGGPPSASAMYNAPRSPLDRLQNSAGVQLSPTLPGQQAQSQQNLNDLGRGVPLHRIASSTPMFIVEFKAGRQDIFFCSEPGLADVLQLGDAVIVEADRGKDIGNITRMGITPEEVEAFQRLQMQRQSRMMGEDEEPGSSPIRTFGKEVMPKRLYAKASPQDINMLALKADDEAKALLLCQTKVRAKKLPMEVVEAEYQWDRRKLTFYFVSDRRIDFRELVRELFRLYKTRIWMACLQGPASADA